MKKYIDLTVSKLLVSGLLMSMLCSCSKWTEPESLPMHVPSLQEQNPELYEAYCASLREYRNSDHKVMIAKFDNSQDIPGSRADHISCLPDSTDYVILSNPDNLHPLIMEEMAEIRGQKGIRTLYTISYDTIEKEYSLYAEQWEEEHPEEPETGNGNEPDALQSNANASEDVMKPFDEYLAEQTDYLLTLASKYGYDGIVADYDGVFPDGLRQPERDALKAFQDIFFGKIDSWYDSNRDKTLLFEGMPVNVMYDNTFFAKCRYISIDVTSATTDELLDFTTLMALTQDVPTDRIVSIVTMPSLNDAQEESGYFTDIYGNKVLAIHGVAQWCDIPSESFSKSGICVECINNDYYNSEQTYKNVRKAISAINHSSLN